MTEGPYRFQSVQYALRGVSGTDLLAFRAVAEGGYLKEGRVMDLGCGTGRSSRFLKALGHEVVGVDVSAEMVDQAKRLDPVGNYHVMTQGGRIPMEDQSVDGFFSSWMLLELGTSTELVAALSEAARVVKPAGVGVVVVNTPEFYRGDWVSCEVGFPENREPLVSGQKVKVVLQPEGVELFDYFWSDTDFRSAFAGAGFDVCEVSRPLGRDGDTEVWKDERHLAPYAVYVLRKT